MWQQLLKQKPKGKKCTGKTSKKMDEPVINFVQGQIKRTDV